MISLLVLLACHRPDPEPEPTRHEVLSPVEDTGTTSSTDTDPDTDTSPETVLVWEPVVWEGTCSALDLLDVDLSIPKGVPVTTYLRVADGYGVSTWRDAREGVVLWGSDGKADIWCNYSGRDSSWFPIVEGVRVVWVVQVEVPR